MENFGAGTGNLVAYFNGRQCLEDKIMKADKIFFTPLNVSPQFKEQIVISWLSCILSSNKVLEFTLEEKQLMWVTLRKFLCSERLKCLHSQHWICTFTPEFIETLLSTISETTTAADIKLEVLLICDRIISLPSLSPQILILLENSFSFCNSIISYARENGLPSSLFPLLTNVIQRCLVIAKHRLGKVDAVATLYERMLFNLLELKFIILKGSSPKSEQLSKEIDNLIMIVFSSDNESLYLTILSLPTIEESKIQMPNEGKNFYGFLVQCISHDDKNVATCILKEFSSLFFKSYISSEYIPLQYLTNLLYLLGITLKEGAQVESNSMAAQSINPSLVGEICREQFIASILEALCQVNSDRIETVWQFPLNSILMSLATEIFNETNADTLKCALLILKLNPELATDNNLLLDSLLNCKFKTNAHDSSLYYRTISEVLAIHIKLRRVDELYRRICKFLVEMNNPKKRTLKGLKELFTYDRDNVFESNMFMREFLFSIKDMGLQMWMSLWSSIHDLLATDCHTAFARDGKDISIKRVSAIGLAVWFSSCCLSAMSVLDAVPISGIAAKIAHMMNNLAQDCIVPLVEDMLMMEEAKSELFPYLMNLVFVWSERHASLLSTDTGYRDFTSYPTALVSDNPDHFCAQTPFINSEKWEQILSTCYNETDDHSRFAVTQLMIQKLMFVKMQDIELQSQGLKPADSIIQNSCLDKIFSMEDAENYPLTLNLVTFQLPLLISSAQISHKITIARMLVSGIQENNECWISFARSISFKECSSTQSLVFSAVCEKALLLLTGNKKKLIEEDVDLKSEVSGKHLSRKILKSLLKLQDISAKSEFDKEFQLCFSFLSTLLTSNRSRLQKRSEDEVLALLRVIDLLPLPSLQPKLLMSVFALCLTLLAEEGGFNGRLAIARHILRILNRGLSSQHAFWVFKLMKTHPFTLLQWATKELDTALNFFPADDSHLNVILMSQCPSVNSGDCLGELLYFMSTLTKTFLQWAQLGEKCLKYVETIVEESRNFKNTDASLLAFSAVVAHQKKILENPKTVPQQPLVKAIEIGCKRCLEISKDEDLCRITNVTLSCCLTCFSFVLVLKERISVFHQNEVANSGPKRGVKRKHNSDGDMARTDETKTKEKDLNIDWDSLVVQGERLANLASEACASELKELGFTFFMGLASSPDIATGAVSWNAFQKAWEMPCVRKKSDEIALKTLFSKLSPKQYKYLVGRATTTIELSHDGQTLDHLLAIVEADVSNSLSHTKKVAIDHVISVLCILLPSPQLSRDGATYISRILEIFLAALNTKSLLPHSKALILNASDKIVFQALSTPTFLKVFDYTSKILQYIFLKDFKFAANRTTSVMSLFTRLASEVIHRSVEEQSLSEAQVKELLACCDVLEMIVSYVKRHYVEFTRVAPFSLAKMLEKMQESMMNSLVKESIQRIIYALMDVSDNFCLLHLMVTLRPATAAVLKQMYTTFSNNYKFNPRT